MYQICCELLFLRSKIDFVSVFEENEIVKHGVFVGVLDVKQLIYMNIYIYIYSETIRALLGTFLHESVKKVFDGHVGFH